MDRPEGPVPARQPGVPQEAPGGEGILHDQAMKQHFAERPQKAFRFYGGNSAAHVPADAELVLQRQETVSEILGKGHRLADVLLLTESPARGTQAFFLFEEEATPTRMAVFRLAECTLRIAAWLELRHPRAELIPVMVVVGPGPLDAELRIGGAGRMHLLFSCDVRRIAEMDGVEAVERGDEVALTHVMSMRTPRDKRVELCARALVRLRGLLPDDRFLKYAEYLLYCARFDKPQRVELTQIVERLEPGMDTLFDDLRNEGRAEGRAEGLTEGRASLLLLLLRDRKLPISVEDEARIMTCQDPGVLEKWFRAALHASDMSEVFGSAALH